MNATLSLVAVGGVLVATLGIFLWVYWNLAMPTIRQNISFRIENELDKLKLLGLKGEVAPGSKLFIQLNSFLVDSLHATQNVDWVTLNVVPKEEVRQRSIRIKSLLREMDAAHPSLRKILDESVCGLTNLYVAQRPFLIVLFAPMVVLAIFVQRYKAKCTDKQVEFAASTLALA